MVRLTPVGDWSSMHALEVEAPHGFTDVVATPDGLYLLDGQTVRFALGADTEPFTVTRSVGSFWRSKTRSTRRRHDGEGSRWV